MISVKRSMLTTNTRGGFCVDSCRKFLLEIKFLTSHRACHVPILKVKEGNKFQQEIRAVATA